MIEPCWDVIHVTTDPRANYAKYSVDSPENPDTVPHVDMVKVWWAQLTPSTLMGVITAHHYAVAGFKCERCQVIIFASELAQLKHDCDEIRDYKAAAFHETMRSALSPTPPIRRRTQEDLWR